MIVLTFHREAVCMGDDAGNGKYTVTLPDHATLGDLIEVVWHGGCGNDWPIPYTGADSYWVIRSDIGILAKLFTDADGEWHVAYDCYPRETPLKEMGVEWVFGARE